MKPIFALILLFPLIFFGQNKNDLLSSIEKKDQKIASLNEEINMLKRTNKDLKLIHLKQLEERTSILKDINLIWLSEPFKNKYTSDYFLDTQFSKLDDGAKERMNNSQVMAKSFLLSEDPKSSLYNLAVKVDKYNVNYFLLDSITKEVLEKKYDTKGVETALNKLQVAPELDNSTPMGVYKNSLIKLLENYHTENCILASELNNYYIIFKDDGNPYKKSELKKKIIFNEEYPVLVQTRDNFIEDYNFYGKEENRLPDSFCPEQNSGSDKTNESKELELDRSEEIIERAPNKTQLKEEVDSKNKDSKE